MKISKNGVCDVPTNFVDYFPVTPKNSVTLSEQNKENSRSKNNYDLDHFIFSSNKHRGKKIPKWMKKLTFIDLPSIFGSLTVFKPLKFTNAQQRVKFIEFKRQLSDIKANWKTAEDSIHVLRDFLIEAMTMFPYITIDVTAQHKQLIYHHIYDENCLFPLDMSKCEINPDLNSPNFIFEFVQNATSKTKQLTTQKLKSMLKQMVSDGYDSNHIREKLMDKCYILPISKFSTKEAHLAIPTSWFLPFIKPELMMMTFVDEKVAMKVFHNQMTSIKSKLENYVILYCAIGSMSIKERKAVFHEKSEHFKTLLSRPDVQTLYLKGFSHEKITQYVYDNFSKEVDRITTFKNIVRRKRVEKDRKMTVSRSKMRDEKYHFLFENEFTFDCFSNENSIVPKLNAYPQSSSNLYGVAAIAATAVVTYMLSSSVKQISNSVETTLSNVAQTAITYSNLGSQLNRSVETTNAILQNAKEWTSMSVPKLMEYSSTESGKLFLIETKTLLHMLYYMCYGTKMDVMAWASNLLITRSEHVYNMLSAINIEELQNSLINYPAVVKVGGTVRNCTSSTFTRLCSLFDMNISQKQKTAEAFKLLPADEIVLQSSSNSVSLIDTLLSFYLPGNALKLSESDIRVANSQFTYMNNVRRDTQQKYSQITTCISFLTRTLFGFDPVDPDFQKMSMSALKIILEVDNLKIKVKDLPKEKETMQFILNLYDEAKTLNVHPRMCSLSGFITTAFHARMRILAEYADVASRFISNYKNRPEPPCILFTDRKSVV